MKNERQIKILELIGKYDIETQEALLEKLKEEGIHVTQATVSRDIKELDIEQLNDDPTKILLKGGYDLSEKLFNDYGIEDERTNEKTTMLLTGIGTNKAKLERLKKALKKTR